MDGYHDYRHKITTISSLYNHFPSSIPLAIAPHLLAWTALAHHAPHVQDTALPAMLTLHRLRRGIEKHFPNARPFQRPGFDTVRFPKK
jgi:hypothetical protein